MAEPENKDSKFLASKLKSCFFFSSLLHSWEEAEGGEEQIRACHLGSVAARGGGRGNAKLGLILPPGRHSDTETSPGFRKKLETLGRAAPKHPKGDQLTSSMLCASAVWEFRDLSGCRRREMAIAACTLGLSLVPSAKWK